ncbi:MAG: phosphoserine phosphatase [Methanosarcinales archaeon]|nr:MAG: phosphoserine phosphatase [Methanosarcinales archaeon]
MTDDSNPPKNASDMTEKELKSHVNSLRQQVDRLNKDIRKSIEEIKLHRGSIDELRNKRDELNAKVKEYATKASACRKARDAINQKIADLKKPRSGVQVQISQQRSRLDQLKAKRDKLNSIAKMQTSSLEKAYANELYVFIQADIPLNHEIDSMERLKQLGERLVVSREADAVHSELIPIYKEIREMRKTGDNAHQEIQILADESQTHHEELLSTYKNLDAIRKEANLYHTQLKEKYRIVKPLSKSIDANKVTVERLRDDLSLHIDAMKGMPKERSSAGIDTDQHEIALEKFKSTGRMSLKELQVLMEHDDIKFD